MEQQADPPKGVAHPGTDSGRDRNDESKCQPLKAAEGTPLDSSGLSTRQQAPPGAPSQARQVQKCLSSTSGRSADPDSRSTASTALTRGSAQPPWRASTSTRGSLSAELSTRIGSSSKSMQDTRAKGGAKSSATERSPSLVRSETTDDASTPSSSRATGLSGDATSAGAGETISGAQNAELTSKPAGGRYRLAPLLTEPIGSMLEGKSTPAASASSPGRPRSKTVFAAKGRASTPLEGCDEFNTDVMTGQGICAGEMQGLPIDSATWSLSQRHGPRSGLAAGGPSSAEASARDRPVSAPWTETSALGSKPSRPVERHGLGPVSGAGSSDPAHHEQASEPEDQTVPLRGLAAAQAPDRFNWQARFDAIRRQVAMFPYQQKERAEQFRELGADFLNTVHDRVTEAPFPDVHLSWRENCIPTGFTEEDKTAIHGSTGLRFFEAGGEAGGLKAELAECGLFLKFAFDHKGIYGSTRMAAKAAKREVGAVRWVHGLNSLHVSSPMLEKVDLRLSVIPVDNTRPNHVTVRVQVFAKVAVRKHGPFSPLSTLRVGSADALKSLHVDESQNDVVQQLADSFFLARCTLLERSTEIVKHSYSVAGDGAPSTLSESILSWLDLGKDEMRLRAIISAACDAESLSIMQVDLQQLSKQDQQVVEAFHDQMSQSKARLDSQPTGPVNHTIVKTTPSTGSVSSQLPFDVEVHQLPSGQRVVLDTHRLLIPDVLWMDWIQEKSKCQVWLVPSKSSRSAGVERKCLDTTPKFTTEGLCNALELCFGEACDFDRANICFDRNSGCAVVPCGSRGGKFVAIVACSSWYYCGNMFMTCMLPPEAAQCLRRLSGDSDTSLGICPDGIMNGAQEHVESARQAIRKLHKAAFDAESGHTCPVLNDFKQSFRLMERPDDPARVRTHLKQALHKYGLGLRHARHLLEGELDDKTRQAIEFALLYGGQSSKDRARDLAARIEHSQIGPQLSRAVACEAVAYASKGVLVQHRADLAGRSQSVILSRKVMSECDATEQAADLGLHTKSPATATRELVQELSHLQHVGGASECDILQSLAEFASLSSGLERVHLLSLVRRYSAKSDDADAFVQCSVQLAAYLQHRHPREAHAVYRRINEKKEHTCLESCIGESALLLRAGRQEEALQIMTRFRSTYPDPPLEFQRQLGECYLANSNTKDSKEVYDGALKQLKESKGKRCVDCPEYADLMVAVSQFSLKEVDSQDYKTALGQLNECRNIYRRCYGSKSPVVATKQYMIAKCLQSWKSYTEALDQFKKCLSIRQEVLGAGHPDYTRTQERIAEVYASRDQVTEAMRKYTACMEHRKRSVGSHDDWYKQLVRKAAGMLRRHLQGNSDVPSKSEPSRQLNELEKISVGIEQDEAVQKTLLEIIGDGVWTPLEIARAFMDRDYVQASMCRIGSLRAHLDAMVCHGTLIELLGDATSRWRPTGNTPHSEPLLCASREPTQPRTPQHEIIRRLMKHLFQSDQMTLPELQSTFVERLGCSMHDAVRQAAGMTAKQLVSDMVCAGELRDEQARLTGDGYDDQREIEAFGQHCSVVSSIPMSIWCRSSAEHGWFLDALRAILCFDGTRVGPADIVNEMTGPGSHVLEAIICQIHELKGRAALPYLELLQGMLESEPRVGQRLVEQRTNAVSMLAQLLGMYRQDSREAAHAVCKIFCHLCELSAYGNDAPRRQARNRNESVPVFSVETSAAGSKFILQQWRQSTRQCILQFARRRASMRFPDGGAVRTAEQQKDYETSPMLTPLKQSVRDLLNAAEPNVSADGLAQEYRKKYGQDLAPIVDVVARIDLDKFLQDLRNER